MPASMSRSGFHLHRLRRGVLGLDEPLRVLHRPVGRANMHRIEVASRFLRRGGGKVSNETPGAMTGPERPGLNRPRSICWRVWGCKSLARAAQQRRSSRTAPVTGVATSVTVRIRRCCEQGDKRYTHLNFKRLWVKQ